MPYVTTKYQRLLREVRAHPELTQQELADRIGSTINSVNVMLFKARKAGVLARRPIDVARCSRDGGTRLHWLPDELRADYLALRTKVGPEEARRLIREHMQVRGIPERAVLASQ